MPKKIAPEDNEANMPNGNDGTSGTNQQFDQVEANRNRQLAEVEANRQKEGAGQQKAGLAQKKTTGVGEQKAPSGGQQQAKPADKK